MSRFIQGNCVHIMSGFPDNAVDFILTDPPYLVGFRDRQGRTIAGDKTDEWLQPACHEMYRVLKKDALMVSFYGWNRIDRFMAAWKQAGFSVVGHLVSPKTYTSKVAYVGYRHECAYIPARLCSTPLPAVALPAWPPSRLAVATSVSNCWNSTTGTDSNVWLPSGAPCSTRPLTTSSRRPRNELCRTRKTPRRSGGSRQQQ